MRKSSIFAAIALIAMCSCSKDEVQNRSDVSTVSFGTFVDGQSRAATKDAFAVGDQFGVFAYYTDAANYVTGSYDPDFMYNQAVVKSTDGWSYSPLKYWPNRVNSSNGYGKVSFFAYWPMAAAANGVTVKTLNSLAADPLITYSASDPAKRVDLLWGVSDTGLPHLNLSKPADATSKIKFTFKHALSRVGFEVRLAGDILSHNDATHGKTTVTVNSIEFGGKLNATTPEGDLDGLLTDKADLNLNNTVANAALWTNPQGTLYSLKLTSFTDGGVFGTGGAAISAAAAITNTDNAYFMIIPQDFSTSNAKMRITYTVTTVDTALAGGKSEIVNRTVADVSADFTSGKAYKYVMTIGLTSVKFDNPVISPWEESTVPVLVN